MAENPAATTPPPGRAALGFALAALAASWNPFAAPLGLVVGIAAAVLAFRALKRAGARRRIAGAALAVSLFAVVASALLLAVTAGTVGVDLPGEPVLKARTSQELDRVLSDAAERTRAERERARVELKRLAGAPRRASDGGPASDGGTRAVPDGGVFVPDGGVFVPDGGAR